MNKKEELINKIENIEDPNLNIMVFTNLLGEEFKYSRFPEKLDDLYEIGSASKMFTSLSIFILMERGALNIEDPISNYLTEDHKNLLMVEDFDYSTVTIKSVLNHTSGIGEHLNSGDDENLLTQLMKENKEFVLEDMIKMAKENPLLKFKEPHTGFQYSNIGYILLGKVIEFVSKKSYKDFIRENIFKKLGMDNSLFISDNSNDPRILKGTFLRNPSNMIPSLAQAAGEIISNLEDMKKFLSSVWNEELVSRNTLDIILKSIEDSPVNFGYGFYKENNLIGHGGQTFGFLTKSFYNPDNKEFLLIAINEAESKEEMNEITKLIV